MKNYIKNKKIAFTLVELLVVISIIGILSSVVFASLDSARKKARDAKRISNVKQIQIALELYYDKYGYYPTFLNLETRCNTTVSGSLNVLVTEGFLQADALVDPINQTGTPNLCYEYASIGNADAINASAWYCDGDNRSSFLYTLLFSVENSTLDFSRLTNSLGQIQNSYTYCIHGPGVPH